MRPFIYCFLGDIAKVEESWKIPTKARSGKESEMNNYIVLDHFYFLLLVLKEWLCLMWCFPIFVDAKLHSFECTHPNSFVTKPQNAMKMFIQFHNKNIDKLARSKKTWITCHCHHRKSLKLLNKPKLHRRAKINIRKFRHLIITTLSWDCVQGTQHLQPLPLDPWRWSCSFQKMNQDCERFTDTS